MRPVLALVAMLAVPACSPAPDTTPAPAPVATPHDSGPAAAGDERSRKRSPPPRVEPVVLEGIRYEELRGGKGRGLPQNGGYIVAIEEASGRELWIAKVYDVVYDEAVEDDKRDAYIVHLRADRARRVLLIENERRERYALNLRDRTVEVSAR